MSPRPVELPKPEFQEALRLAREGSVARAIHAVEQELSRQPDRESCAPAAVKALSEIARLAETQGDLGTAEQALTLALYLKPRYADLRYQRACVLLALQRRSDARHELDAAIELNPRYLAARLERAMLDAREGMIGDALGALRSLSQDLPVEDPRAFQQGLKSLERADWDEADALLRRGLKLTDPVLAERLERLRAHLERGEAAEAVTMLREIMPGHASYPDLHYLLGIAELALGHFDDALVALGRALELHPDFHDARVQFARGLEAVGASEEAAEQLALVLQHEPANRGALELSQKWSERPGRGGDAAIGQVRQESIKHVRDSENLT